MSDPMIEAIEEFLCPGCVCGSQVEGCSAYKEHRSGCDGWVPGTLLMPGGAIALGFPKGFNKIPFASYQRSGGGKFTNRLHNILLNGDEVKLCVGEKPLNMVIWWLVKEGHTFLKIFRPRINLVEIGVTPLTPTQIRELGIDLPEEGNIESIYGQID